MKRKSYITGIGVAGMLLFYTSAFATNGYQLIGVGSYQKSLAGAVTALPGSNMTAVTNPAGMMRIGHRADFSMEAFMPDRSTDFTAFGGEKAESSSEIYGIPAIGWNGPVGSREDMVFGGGMYGTSGMGVDYGSTLMQPPMEGVSPGVYWDGYSSIAFWQMAPSLAWQAAEKLSLGASINIDFQQVAFQQRMLADSSGDGQGDMVVTNFDLSRGASAFGFGLSLGIMYDLNEMVTLGASYKSKQFFTDLEYQLAYGDINFGTPLPGGTYKLDLDFPQQAAVGIAVHAAESFTVAADVKWINWSDTMETLAVSGPGGIQVPMDPGWDDQVVFAIGLAYKVNDRFNLRAGFNYGESPIDGESAANNLVLPAIVETHYTVGADYRLDDHWEIGCHYMYVPENTVTAGPETSAPGVKISLSEQSVGVNLGYRF
ncbi:MAG: aromatic hydrocarbon degradation protein [Desulfobacterales bacterium SG8_35]|nr:MAG: aromatic hydrocarbon degradation protein [Desulfobacterales bacterium SG8_35]